MFVHVFNVRSSTLFTDHPNEMMILMKCGTEEVVNLISSRGFRQAFPQLAKHFALCLIFCP